jgi:hypothetical protein
MTLAVEEAEEREAVIETAPQHGLGRELFGAFRDRAGSAEAGASLFAEDQWLDRNADSSP